MQESTEYCLGNILGTDIQETLQRPPTASTSGDISGLVRRDSRRSRDKATGPVARVRITAGQHDQVSHLGVARD